MESQPREIQRYVTPEGRVPFAQWLEAVQDRTVRAKIKFRLDRVEEGNLGNYRSVGEGVFEFKINYGPGYRVYFGQVGFTVILLLCGGDKSTQQKDIQKAKEYWRDYHARR
ncbi:type II toxin-antitoxin system RelE/ParE family toxin [Planktothrix paucivesiculata]|nr:type II toxin-antitoxin system RelE/ParE family toxin [Planktothrix paucivesiculata]